MNAIVKKGPYELAIEAELARGELEAEQVEGAKVTTDAISAAQAEYHEAARHIGSDTLLNDAGKKVHLAQLQENQANRYHKICDDRLAGLSKRIAELLYTTRPQSPDSDPQLEFMRQAEVRQLLAGKDELELIASYQSLAVDASNDLLMRSIENAPIPMIGDPAILEAGKAARGLRESPESAKTLRQLRTVHAVIKSALDSALIELNRPDLTLEQAAAGITA